MQLSLPQITPLKRLEYWAGYTFSMPLGDQWKWCRGVVLTPRYARRAAKECRGLPVMMDNGAFAAWKNGVALPFSEHMSQLIGGIETLGRTPERIILPDIVADGAASFARSKKSIELLAARYGLNRLWLPIQEGMDVHEAMRVAKNMGGIFIGGATKQWKLDVVRYLRWYNKTIPVHIGRLSKPQELAEAVYVGANSFDTTTFMRQQHINRKIKWHDRFRLCVEQAIMGDNIILLSGGPDSVALLEHCKQRGSSVACCLWIDYGQPARHQEYKHAQAAADRYGVRLEVRKVSLGLGDMGEGVGAQVVPGRNAVLCTIAANLAASCGAKHVLIGSVMEDAKNYADCTTKYVRDLTAITKPFGVQVLAPWTYQRKAEVAKLIPPDLDTWSCYSSDNNPCGECASCKQRGAL